MKQGVTVSEHSWLGRMVGALRPCHIEQLLYQADATTMSQVDAPQLANAQAELRHYDQHCRSGIARIDNKINASRECYTAWVDGRLAHESWLRNDVLLPARFGFPRHIPVVGDSFTVPAFRGRRLYPWVLQQLVRDILGRNPAATVFILVAPDNVASNHGIQRGGFQAVAQLSGWRVLGLIWGKRTDPAPRWTSNSC